MQFNIFIDTDLKEIKTSYRISFLYDEMVIGGCSLGKKLKKNNYNWTFEYIKQYNEMVSYYEKQLEEKSNTIESLENENKLLKSNTKLITKRKQISR